MHFSRPSGCRLSWWRPWKRSAVGFFSSGYSSVLAGLNIVAKVTPNPATEASGFGSLFSSLLLIWGRLLGGGAVRRQDRYGGPGVLGPGLDLRGSLSGQRRDREAADRRLVLGRPR